MRDDLVPLGEYLRARRNVRQPEDVGLERFPGRRVPGLRRDEVAALAGISAEYFLRLEQGRGARPSDQVLQSLARVLGLDDEARSYLFRLATGSAASTGRTPSHSADQIARVLGQWTQTPAYLSDAHRDIVASNPLASILGHGGLAEGSNVVLDLFHPRMKGALVEWETMTRSAVATLRRDADPASPRLRELVRALSQDPDFVRIWARYDVSGPEVVTFHQQIDGVGEIEIEAQNFGVRSMPGHLLTVLSAPAGSTASALFAHLVASLAAPDEAGTTRASHSELARS